MGHHHEHDSPDEMRNYLTQQIVTVAICGALGAVAVSLYAQGTLQFILARDFHRWVLMGGIALLVMTVIRGIALWNFAGQLQKAWIRHHDRELAHDHHHDHDHEHAHHHHEHEHAHHHHEHEHEHTAIKQANPAITTIAGPTLGLNVITPPALPAAAHAHDHDCCDHDHDHDHGHDHAEHGHQHHDHDHGHQHHDHDHGWAPWRYVLLLLPVALFMLNLPSDGFSDDYQKKVNLEDFDLTAPPEGKGEDAFDVRFLDLEMAAMYPELRNFYAGKNVRLSGKYSPLDDSHFTLVRYKINCCAADAIPLNAVIWLDSAQVTDPRQARLSPDQMRNKWVIVEGRVHFIKRRDKNQYMTALIVTPTASKPLANMVKMVPSDPAPYTY